VTVPKGVAGKMKPVLERKDPLVAPLPQNSQVGTLKMMVDGKPLMELPVVALEEVEPGLDLRPRLGFDPTLAQVRPTARVSGGLLPFRLVEDSKGARPSLGGD
jgi:hypothetical protein